LVSFTIAWGLAAAFFLNWGCAVDGLEGSSARGHYCHVVDGDGFLLFLVLAGPALVGTLAYWALHRRGQSLAGAPIWGALLVLVVEFCSGAFAWLLPA
jgi:hypothetical protein